MKKALGILLVTGAAMVGGTIALVGDAALGQSAGNTVARAHRNGGNDRPAELTPRQRMQILEDTNAALEERARQRDMEMLANRVRLLELRVNDLEARLGRH